MRPNLLNTLFRPVAVLPGIGSRLGRLIEKIAGPRILDLLWHLPSGIIDRRFAPELATAPTGIVASVTVKIDAHYPSRNKRQPYKVKCSDNTGNLILVFFHARTTYLTQILPVGETRIISGKLENFDNQLQMTHPDHITSLANAKDVLRIEPIYPVTAGLSVKVLGKAIRSSFNAIPVLPEWLDTAMCRSQNWPSWHLAIESAHNPQAESDLNYQSPARRRLAYDELLANQLALALIRQTAKKENGRAIKGNSLLRDKIIKSLPFHLTPSQKYALREIENDMASDHRMLRLLQGDVGSGKTILSILAMLNAIESGFQAALMAPTEILARQHYETILKFTKNLGIKSVLLTGREKGKKRKELLEDINSSDVQLVVGTHALFQSDVIYSNLAIAIIDEQHRFGVAQRLTLNVKGKGCDMLVMTATPIPRTLMLTAYGDIDVSQLTEKPTGRKAIITRVISDDRIHEIIDRMKNILDSAEQIFWICPIIEESETQDLAAAQSRYQHLKNIFGKSVGLVHGRMTINEKDLVMSAFNKGTIKILVATTIIEVGIDVANATIIIVEQAERFGLSQLHQLRGRVGRSDKQSSCVLVYHKPITEMGRKRLEVMRNSDDGFAIAEEDLKLRGAGELLGTRQSGLPVFRVANLAAHNDLLPMAHKDTKLLLQSDPDLETKRGKALRYLMYLFEREGMPRNIHSG